MGKWVTARITFECGRCGNVQRRNYEAKDGLLTIPQVYCGCCVRQNNFTVMSAVVSDTKVHDDEKAEVQRPGGRSDVPAAGRTAETAGAPVEGRKPADKTDDADLKSEAGKRSAEGLPGAPAAKAKVDGKPAK